MPTNPRSSVKPTKGKPSLAEMKRRKAAGTLTGEEQAYVRLSPNTTKTLIEDDFSDWDMEELVEGRRRDKNGGFTGRKASVVPAALVREHHKRVFDEAHAKMREGMAEAVDMLMELVNGADVDDAVRLRAIELVMNRVLGRDVVSVDVSVQSAPWQGLMATSIVAFNDEERLALTQGDEEDIVDAEVVE